MRILVTGGGGFIGGWIVRRLVEAGHVPVIFDLHENRARVAEIAGARLADDLDWIAGDITVTYQVIAAARGCDRIIHLAGLLTPACRDDPVLGAQVNLIGTINAFLAARANGIGSVAWMSSAGVFGPDGGTQPRPTSQYGAFKLGAEHSARAFLADDGIASVAFRPYVVYGPGREVGLSAGPSLACRAAALGEPYTIPFTGQIDLIHADDVARIFLAAIEAPPAGAHAVNLIGRRATTEDVARLLTRLVPGASIDAAGPPLQVAFPQTEPALAELFADWEPMQLEDGLAGTVAHYSFQASL